MKKTQEKSSLPQNLLFIFVLLKVDCDGLAAPHIAASLVPLHLQDRNISGQTQVYPQIKDKNIK